MNRIELVKEFRENNLFKTVKYALLPTKMSSGNWIWFQQYFKLYSKYAAGSCVAKVTFDEAIEIQHQSTQGSPEGKSAGGSYYRHERESNYRRNRPSYQEDHTQEYSKKHSNTYFEVKPSKKNYKSIEAELLSNILGQDDIISDIMKKIARKDFSLSTDKKKPLSFFWAGPTGVGKTETALQIGKLLSLPVIRIDMSEYMHDHNVSRLIGSPPGYIGFSQPGVLQECDNQECIILIDEIEKASSQIFNIFLQVLDYGSLTDGRNHQINLTKAIIVMTSNVGAQEMNSRTMGLVSTSESDKKSTVLNAMNKTFSPEFINRLSSIQVFNSLNINIVKTIVNKQLSLIIAATESQYKVKVTISLELKEKLYKAAYNPLMGARPIHRALESLVLEPLSAKILIEEASGCIEL